MTIIAIFNQKGGVGKPTTSLNLAAALLSVTDANIVALDKPDMVNVAFTLRQHRNE